MFFLHLLGLDTTGHAYRPFSKVCFSHPSPIHPSARRASGLHVLLTGHCFVPELFADLLVLCVSQEYMNNIRVVDSIVRQTEELLAEFYEDDKETSFVFTADHGMSVIGNHGDGGEVRILLLSIFSLSFGRLCHSPHILFLAYSECSSGVFYHSVPATPPVLFLTRCACASSPPACFSTPLHLSMPLVFCSFDAS